MKAQDTEKMTGLERQIYGNNLIQDLALKNLEIVLLTLEQFKGKKIALSDGSSSSKLKKALKFLEVQYNDIDCRGFRTFLKFSSNGINLFQDVNIKVKSYESGGYGCQYHKLELNIGNIDENGNLTELYSLLQVISDYNLNKIDSVNEVKSILSKIDKVDTELKALKRKASKYLGIF